MGIEFDLYPNENVAKLSNELYEAREEIKKLKELIKSGTTEPKKKSKPQKTGLHDALESIIEEIKTNDLRIGEHVPLWKARQHKKNEIGH
jgi:hypothetical protein